MQTRSEQGYFSVLTLEGLTHGKAVKLCKKSGECKAVPLNEFEYNEKRLGKIVLNSKEVSENCIFAAIKGENANGEAFAAEAFKHGAVAVICTFGGAERIGYGGIYVEVDDVRLALSRAAESLRECGNFKVVAITGSVGKTTVKEMCIRVLSEKYLTDGTIGNYNNKLGVSLTMLNAFSDVKKFDERGNSNKFSDKYLVLELGISHPQEMEALEKIAKPNIVVITNVLEMHIGNFKNRDELACEKLKIIGERCEVAVYDGSNSFLASKLSKLSVNRKIRIIPISGNRDNSCAYIYSNIVYDTAKDDDYEMTEFDLESDDGEKFASLKIPALGEYIAYDGALASTVGRLCGCDCEQIRRGLLNYSSIGLRQSVSECDGILRIVDCYNAGPSSMRAALSVLNLYARSRNCLRRVAVLGNMSELGECSEAEHTALGKVLCNYGIELLFTVGSEAKRIALGAVNCGISGDNIVVFEDIGNLSEIKQAIEKRLKKGDAVLYKASRSVRLERLL